MIYPRECLLLHELYDYPGVKETWGLALIPKNASSWATSIVVGDPVIQSLDHLTNSAVCILRDPVQRWITGVKQFLKSCKAQEQNWSDEKIIEHFTNVLEPLDSHTVMQSYFAKSLGLNSTTWFYLDDNFNTNFYHWINKNNITVRQNVLPTNVSKNSESDLILTHRMNKLLENKKFKNCIIDYYKPDYDLINSVNFYEAR